MKTLDPTEEWRHLSELYRQMTDDELMALARQKSELTELARPILVQEISQRGLLIPPEEPPPPPPVPEEDSECQYDVDREFIDFLTVWSLRDATQVQSLLDTAGIPFQMGPEKAGADAVTSNFAAGVSVQVMRIGLPWARQALNNYAPQDQPESEQEKEDEDKETPVRCPNCRSTEVIFGSLDTEPEPDSAPRSKFNWTCDSCRYRWEDDGVVKEE